MKVAILILAIIALLGLALFAAAMLYVSLRILLSYTFNKRPLVTVRRGMVLEECGDGTGRFKEANVKVPESLARWLRDLERH